MVDADTDEIARTAFAKADYAVSARLFLEAGSARPRKELIGYIENSAKKTVSRRMMFPGAAFALRGRTLTYTRELC